MRAGEWIERTREKKIKSETDKDRQTEMVEHFEVGSMQRQKDENETDSEENVDFIF